MFKLTSLLLVAGLAATAFAEDASEGQQFVVLVSGVDCYFNCHLSYSVEAENAHLYHVFVEHGVPPENIIVFADDNLVNDTYINPLPGKLYDSLEHKDDVYAGVKIDYRGDEVNANNILAVIQGQKDKVKGGTGRVIQSTANDRIFVYHGGHGDTGYVVLPNGSLTKKELGTLFDNLNKEKKIKELTYYIMACFSGTMFDKVISADGNIYASTAAGTNEYAYAHQLLETYVDGWYYYVFVNTQFTNSWLNDTKVQNFNVESLQEQFNNINKSVYAIDDDHSHPAQWGNKAIAAQTVSVFHGAAEVNPSDAPAFAPSSAPAVGSTGSRRWPLNREGELEAMKHARDTTTNIHQRHALTQQIDAVEKEGLVLARHMETIVDGVTAAHPRGKFIRSRVLNTKPTAVNQVDCHHDVVKTVFSACPVTAKSAHLSKFMAPLINLCEAGISSASIIGHLVQTCV